MEKTFYLVVKVQHLDQNLTTIEGSMNYHPGTKADLEKLRDILYGKMLEHTDYFVLYAMGTDGESWVPGTILKNSIVTFRLVNHPSLGRT